MLFVWFIIALLLTVIHIKITNKFDQHFKETTMPNKHHKTEAPVEKPGGKGKFFTNSIISQNHPDASGWFLITNNCEQESSLCGDAGHFAATRFLFYCKK